MTAAPLPADWTRFYLQQTPLGSPSAVSTSQLIQPVGTTYTFTVTDDERGASVITFDLTAARPHPVRPTHKPVLGDVVVTTEFLVPTLRYNLLDTTGAATAPGSYAFLTAAGDATSAIDNFGFLAARGVELRVHPTDLRGVSRADFYDTVVPGATFDYRVGPADCGFRFEVTGVVSTALPLVFAVEFIDSFVTGCGGFVDNPAAPRVVKFTWRTGAGFVDQDGVRVLFPDEAGGSGTYRLAYRSPFIFEVPVGHRITHRGVYIVATTGPDDLSSGPSVSLEEPETRSTLWISLETGEELRRFVHLGEPATTSVDVNSLFDQIVDSIRSAESSASQ